MATGGLNSGYDITRGVRPFDVNGDPSTAGNRWKLWLRSFNLYADSKGFIITDGSDENKQQRRALLLHEAGEGVQAIFNTFDYEY